ncbi:endopeptidase La [Clostridium sp. DL1XJH146]
MNKNNIPRELPVIVIPYNILMHGDERTIRINKETGNEIYRRVENDDFYGLALGVKNEKEILEIDDFYKVGTLVKIKNVKELGKNYEVKIDVIERIKIEEFKLEGEEFRATYNFIEDIIDLDEKNEREMLDYIKEIARDVSKNFVGSETYMEYLEGIDSINKMIPYILPYIDLSYEEMQGFLEIRSLKKKALLFLDYLIEHKESVRFKMEIAAKFNEDANKNYREKMLREQLKAIQEELNEEDVEIQNAKKDYRKLIENAKMPEEVKEVAFNELRKFERQGGGSSEANVIQNYLDLLVSLPWGESEIKEVDIDKARVLLNEQHYGLDKVKDRIIQHLTVMKLKKNKQGSILLLVGPPGTGKTSLGRSVAEALGRKYVRISLGGIRDEAEVRGHRRTYVGALPGRIIQGMKKAGEKNPVFILDEIDKLIASGNGDPSSALLEVLDPEQNNTFADHYLEVPYDLSDVFFIATANSLNTIPAPLRDRMEIIDISSYTSREKFYIAKDYLVSSVLDEHGLNKDQLQIEDEALREIIEMYTREAGVRGLKRQLATVARVTSEKIVSGKVELPYVVKKDMLFDVLGHEITRYDKVGKMNPPGVVTGLAWTPVGGDILFIEGAMMPGNGQLMLTGQLGDVMKESAKISQSLIRSRLAFNMKKIDFSKYDLHIHVPSGAIPKDGPSAGVTLFTTIASLVTGLPVDSKLAMTGEISLRGAVLPVGGIKEKVIAAHRSGIKRIKVFHSLINCKLLLMIKEPD